MEREHERESGYTLNPHLEEREQREVEERAHLRPVVVHETIRRSGEEALEQPTAALAWSGLAAGLSMGFSMVAQGLLHAHLPDTEWRPLLVRLGYSLGFLIVIAGRQQLFTENTITPVLPLFAHPSMATFGQVLRVWSVVLATNLIGALVFATVVAHTEIFSAPVRESFMTLGEEALQGSFWTTLLRGVFAGWLIALMVWLLPQAETQRLTIIVIITYIVGLAGLAHIIAGAVETLYVVVGGRAPWSAFVGWVIPTLLGNVLGGVVLAAGLNSAQVAASERARQ